MKYNKRLERIDSLYGLCKMVPVPTSPSMLSLVVLKRYPFLF